MRIRAKMRKKDREKRIKQGWYGHEKSVKVLEIKNTISSPLKNNILCKDLEKSLKYCLDNI